MLLTKRSTRKSHRNSRERPLKKLVDRLHIPPYLFLSRESDDDDTDIGKHDFRLVLLHPMLSNAIRLTRGARGHFVTLIEVAMHLIKTTTTPVYSQ